MVSFSGNRGAYHALCWSCGKGQHSYAYFEENNSANHSGQRVERNAVTDSNHSALSARVSKRLPRHRQLLAETELLRLFNHVVEQPVPKDLLDLLQRIDARLSIKVVS